MGLAVILWRRVSKCLGYFCCATACVKGVALLHWGAETSPQEKKRWCIWGIYCTCSKSCEEIAEKQIASYAKTKGLNWRKRPWKGSKWRKSKEKLCQWISPAKDWAAWPWALPLSLWRAPFQAGPSCSNHSPCLSSLQDKTVLSTHPWEKFNIYAMVHKCFPFPD